MKASAIIVAGGDGKRLGGDVPKPLRVIGGLTILERSIAPFDDMEAVHEIVVVLPAKLISEPPTCLNRVTTAMRLVVGGPRRQDSVVNGFAALETDPDVIVIHDAARPFCKPDLIEKTLVAAQKYGAAALAIPAQDTIKQVENFEGMPFVLRTLPREQIYLAQTPQAFTQRVLGDALELGRTGVSVTDEAALAEQAGHQVSLVEGDPCNLKITSESDVMIAQGMTRKSDNHSSFVRVGLGYDSHRLVVGRPLVLGGITIPADRGLDGHSDADAVCHAVIDAVLGAANAGDIGQHFSDDDNKWKDASSVDLLHRASELVRKQGFVVDNVDIVVITDWPKIRDYADSMRKALAAALGIEFDCVTIKGKTSEGVGPVGRGEAIVVHAVALGRRL